VNLFRRLQNYLATLSQTVVVVSHDRDFVDAVAEEVIIVRDQILTYFDGTLSEYESARTKIRQNKERQHANIEKNRERLQAQITRAQKHAKARGDDKILAQAASRAKRITKLGMEKTEDGKRFKQSYRVGYHHDFRPQVVLDEPDPPVRMSLPVPSMLRAGGASQAVSARPLVTLEKVTLGYIGSNASTLNNVTLSLTPGMRVALLGSNGAGKSTLIKAIVGSDSAESMEVKVVSGTLTRASAVKIGYMAQHHVAALREQGISSPKLTPVSLVKQWMKLHGNDANLDPYAFLGSFGLGSLGAVPVGELSGGQLSKLALAQACSSSPHVLVTDEPGNYLVSSLSS
jgi:ATPase subunit of ABC transporter with duplicated ATPase domains